jgi:PAS domain S-box-containing protein
MLGAVDVGLWYCDIPFDELQWERKVKEHFWLPPDARVTIDTFYERLHPDDRARTRAAIDRSIAAHEPYDIEYRTVAPPESPDAGAVRWLRAIGYTGYDERGTPVRFDGITVDITRQKRVALALEESESRFRNMADNAPVMIWVTRPDGHCIYLNQQWYDFTGQTPGAAEGYGWLDAVHPDDRARAEENFLAANATLSPFRADYQLRRADGAYRWCVDSAAPRFGPDGQYLGYVGSVIDIHERTEAAAERTRLLDAERAARAEAERANRAKAEFLATMSHELRTPLNAIDGYAELLELEVRGPLAPAQREDIGRIRRSQKHLLGLINAVLNYARIEAGRVELRIADLQASLLLEAVEPLILPQVARKALRFERPPVDPALFLRGDQEKVLQILLNLLSNAVKFTPGGGRVTMTAVAGPDGTARLTVADTGVGIPAEKLAAVFDPFVQVDSQLTREHHGVGLGLAISRDLARGMGGDLEARSELGRGSAFTLVLPATTPRGREDANVR